ncbi:MAG: family 10 glycosylhydrolase [Ginsengibacter sp.]
MVANKIKPFWILFLFSFPIFLHAQPKYEFRGVWVATVDNIDWPSKKNLTTEQQQSEFIKLLDMHKKNGMNAIVAQIRPATDAFYPSPYEPWSEWLTGTQGRPPMPYYDPLDFMIKETHKRNMEFHAWMNPYRATFSIKASSISATHVTRMHPEWFLVYGSTRYFDPGNKEVQKFVVNVVRDVVKNYDIDAIHFDDYFYPYRIPGKDFPDSASFRMYGNSLSKDDWRRSNVDSIIFQLSRAIKQENRFVKFGISPFGVWRNIDKDPDGSNTKAGQTNYDDLYADILLWLKMKCIDYAAPQLYWEFSQKVVGFETLSGWWNTHTYGRQMYVGQGIYRSQEAHSPAWKVADELPKQIARIRALHNLGGSVYFSSKTFEKNPNGWNDSLRNNYYKYPALISPMKWIDSIIPNHPEIIYNTRQTAFNDKINILIANKDASIIKDVIYLFQDLMHINLSDAKNIFLIANRSENNISIDLKHIPADQNKVVIGVTGVSKTNNESELSSIIYLTRTSDGWVVN